MPHPTKIATCCYCSSRTILKPSARDGHELACGSCGAPLHEMKWLKAPAAVAPAGPKPLPVRRQKPTLKTPQKPRKRKKEKRRKPLWLRGLEEAWDILEDIID